MACEGNTQCLPCLAVYGRFGWVGELGVQGSMFFTVV